MITKKCEYCGTVMELPERKRNQRFCSPSCFAKSRTLDVDTDFDWKKFRDGLWVCRYHSEGEIGCTNRQCDKCGWNPKIAESRLEAIRRKIDEAKLNKEETHGNESNPA